jgi:tetratricopeptide (TPR) repeat protein
MVRYAVVIFMAFVLGVSAQAQALIPSSHRLEGMAMVYQDINRCSAAAFTMQLSYYSEERVDYKAVIARMNPHPQDVSVRVEEMITIAQEQFGLKGIVRRGGTIELLKQLVANNFPVLVENSYYDGDNPNRDWMSHNRVVMGYDDATQELLVFDSLLGNGDGMGRAMAYADFDERWLAFNRDYVVLYREENEATLQAILGDMWDLEKNAEWVIEQAQIDLENVPNRTDEGFAMMNMAWAYLQLGEYQTAADLYDAGREMPLPWRYFWYDFGVFEAYLGVGRYEDVIELADRTIAATSGVEELYYFIGLAAEGLGDPERAKGNFEMAVWRNEYFTEAIDALARVNGS